MNFKIVKPKISESELIDYLCQYFPSITGELRDPDDEGLIHLQFGTVARFANELMETGRFDELQKLFSFFVTAIGKLDSRTDNAFYVSFLEHLEFDGGSDKERQALGLIPKEFLESYRTLRSARRG